MAGATPDRAGQDATEATTPNTEAASVAPGASSSQAHPCSPAPAGAGTASLPAGSTPITAGLPTGNLELSGSAAEFVSRADGGNVMRRRVCPACGTALFSEARAEPQIEAVPGE